MMQQSIRIQPSMAAEFIPGCPACGEPNLFRQPRCHCGAEFPPGRRIDADAVLTDAAIPWTARLLIRIGDVLRRLAHKIGD